VRTPSDAAYIAVAGGPVAVRARATRKAAAMTVLCVDFMTLLLG
jgi:hypothetical protein